MFSDLSVNELHELYRLRTAIFVVEQECAYQEVDEHDPKSIHALGFVDDELVACARICPPKTVYQQPSIGRVAVHSRFRGKRYAHELFAASLKRAQEEYPQQAIKIQAQTYLESFYKSFGFTTVSEPYPDFGIMHVDMVLR